MAGEERLEQIVSVVDERGFVSVKELSYILGVSEVTVRRDLQRLHDENRLRRTFGGGVSLHAAASSGTEETAPSPSAPTSEGSLIDRVQVLIATSLDPQSDRALVDRAAKRSIPIVAESLGANGMGPVVSVDNFQAAKALGAWTGNYVRDHFNRQAKVLDLTYRLSNTEARSQGFLAGLREVIPSAQVILSINAQSRYQTAYQLTADALSVHPDINVIFAINDSTARGAMHACRDMDVNPDALLILPFGLEGTAMKEALMEGAAGYCRAGLAMFPDIVAPICVEAAIHAFNHRPMEKYLITPHAILTSETLPQYYTKTNGTWKPNWDTIKRELNLPLKIGPGAAREEPLPKRIGFVIPFSEHEWYQNLTALMQAHAELLGIEFEAVDAAQTLKDDVLMRQRAIAQMAAGQVQPGDVVLIDGSELTTLLAEELGQKENITVITNSVPVFEALSNAPGITLISTGGSLRRSSETLIGPTTEAALRELRADKLFLAVGGISLDFGLSHTNVAEVAVKQAMLRAARQVILLADHTKFGQESIMQVAPATAVNKVITDNALPASVRLDLGKLGIEVLIAKT
ncbi:MAG: substrate-binding domain-containing protein [Chloroflexi bacterium]|nr:substrate-binding domain-containing protein [Chloroflexota bacterium]